MFDKALYLREMTSMVDKAIERIKLEKPDFKIYTVSIWTDPNAAISAINFDSKQNSLKGVEFSNKWRKELYKQSLALGITLDPIEATRIGNPADYELRNFELISHISFPKDWESDPDGFCWEQLEPALIEIGNYSFPKIKELNVESDVELSINSAKDWYDQTWS